MPSRSDIFVNGYIYHVFNKTIDHKNIFKNEKISNLFIKLLWYYRSTKANIRYSHFKRLDFSLKKEREKQLRFEKYFKVEMLTFCLMPNHFHLLLKQSVDKGIIRFMADIINSLTRFYNIFSERKGPLFLPQFKSRTILSDAQLKHVSRYIHLNPYSSGLVENIKELENYKYSSFEEYLNKNKSNLCNTEIILNEFSNDRKRYKNFVFSNAEYQKTLEFVKYSEKWL